MEPRVQTKHGEAAFSRYAAQNWNKLPAELKSAPTVDIFKSRLKHFSSPVLMIELVQSTLNCNLSFALCPFKSLFYAALL